MKITKKSLLNKIAIFSLMFILAINFVALTGAWFTNSENTIGTVSFGGVEFSTEPSVVESGLEEGRIMPGDTLELELTYAVTGDDAWIRLFFGARIPTGNGFIPLLVGVAQEEIDLYQAESPRVFYLKLPVAEDQIQVAHLEMNFNG